MRKSIEDVMNATDEASVNGLFRLDIDSNDNTDEVLW